MREKNLIIFGNGGLASVVRFYCENIGLPVAGFTVDENYLTRDTFEELPNVSFSEVKRIFSPTRHMLFIAIGASDMLGFTRQNKMNEGEMMGYKLFSQIFVNNNLKREIFLGDNTFIMPGCQVDPYVKFGDGVIVWNGATICHHTFIGDFSFIAPGAAICGKVNVGEHCYIGSNATIRDNLNIASQTLVGASAFINHDTVFQGVYLPPRSVKIKRSSNQIDF